MRLGRRNENVPRFLFRAYHAGSGGGPTLSTNNVTSIIPHAFMNNRQSRPFYNILEEHLCEMAYAHYDGGQEPLSGFSSWAASLHLVINYALSCGDDSFIAAMDTHKLDQQVLVWHVPHLIPEGNHEYLAHGIISGRGYTAVSLQAILDHGFTNLYPEFSGQCYGFGEELRDWMFCQPPKSWSSTELNQIQIIARLFGELYEPVATALVCLRPQPWLNRDKGSDCRTPNVKELSHILINFDINTAQSWLRPRVPHWCGRGAVDTTDFPDVRQWIDLLRAIAKFRFQPPPKECTRKRKLKKIETSDTDEARPKLHAMMTRSDTARLRKGGRGG